MMSVCICPRSLVRVNDTTAWPKQKGFVSMNQNWMVDDKAAFNHFPPQWSAHSDSFHISRVTVHCFFFIPKLYNIQKEWPTSNKFWWLPAVCARSYVEPCWMTMNSVTRLRCSNCAWPSIRHEFHRDSIKQCASSARPECAPPATSNHRRQSLGMSTVLMGPCSTWAHNSASTCQQATEAVMPTNWLVQA